MYFSTSFSVVNNLLINCLLFSLVRSLSAWENLHGLVVEYPAPTLGVMDDHKNFPFTPLFLNCRHESRRTVVKDLQ